MKLSSNLKFLRKRKGDSQQSLADALDITRSKLNSYERGVQPPFETLIELSQHFNYSVDALLKYDLETLGEFKLSEIERGNDVDITGQKLRLLTVTEDTLGNETIALVPDKVKAGYTEGYADPEYIGTLPKFTLPFIPQNKTYRCFQLSGDSMLPIPDGSWVTASYVQNWQNIPDGAACIVVTKDDGIVFKLIYKKMEDQQLLLVSTNSKYEPYYINIDQVMEVWRFEVYHSMEFKAN